MSTVRAVVVNPSAPGRLALEEVEPPTPKGDEALVRVAAISLNRGEVKGAQSQPAGARPGWDLAGTVAQAAADGSGPQAGGRVVGLLGAGSWAEKVAVPTHFLAELPQNVSFAQAATLPVAGLTALYAVERGEGLLGRRVLVTGASGGVGTFAVQLANLSGADVVGLVRQERSADAVRTAGAREVVVSDDAAAAKGLGPYHLVVDSVGGRTLANVLGMLAPGGICVAFGATESAEVPLSLFALAGIGRASLYGLTLFNEFAREPASSGLSRLAWLIGEDLLHPQIDVEAPWSEIGAVAQRLLDRAFAGKAVLRVE
jgi:NADPH:quinone reductase-like Zn-dependent oxidoreductase